MIVTPVLFSGAHDARPQRSRGQVTDLARVLVLNMGGDCFPAKHTSPRAESRSLRLMMLWLSSLSGSFNVFVVSATMAKNTEAAEQSHLVGQEGSHPGHIIWHDRVPGLSRRSRRRRASASSGLRSVHALRTAESLSATFLVGQLAGGGAWSASKSI